MTRRHRRCERLLHGDRPEADAFRHAQMDRTWSKLGICRPGSETDLGRAACAVPALCFCCFAGNRNRAPERAPASASAAGTMPKSRRCKASVQDCHPCKYLRQPSLIRPSNQLRVFVDSLSCQLSSYDHLQSLDRYWSSHDRLMSPPASSQALLTPGRSAKATLGRNHPSQR